MRYNDIKKSNICGVNVNIIDKQQTLALVGKWLLSTEFNSQIIVTPNPEMVVAAQKDFEFKKALNSADLAIADGAGLKLVDRRLKIIPGIDLMESLIKIAAQHNYRIVFLGGKPGIADRAALAMKPASPATRGEQFNHVTIESVSAPQDINHASQSEINHLISQLNSIKPHLLFIAFGHGKQEKWMMKYRYQIPAAVMMGVGGALDQIADPSLRPPKFINNIGLGWLYRLIRQPWRWKRQLALLKFVEIILKEKLSSLSSR